LTSAKTGLNVEAAFTELGKQLIWALPFIISDFDFLSTY
jgi:hypothetical protein